MVSGKVFASLVVDVEVVQSELVIKIGIEVDVQSMVVDKVVCGGEGIHFSIREIDFLNKLI